MSCAVAPDDVKLLHDNTFQKPEFKVENFTKKEHIRNVGSGSAGCSMSCSVVRVQNQQEEVQPGQQCCPVPPPWTCVRLLSTRSRRPLPVRWTCGRDCGRVSLQPTLIAPSHDIMHLRVWPPPTVLGRDVGGFNCELAHRNAMLRRTGMRMPGAKKTGTTIVGVVYEVRRRARQPLACSVRAAQADLRSAMACAWACRVVSSSALTRGQPADPPYVQRVTSAQLRGLTDTPTVWGSRLPTRTVRRSTTLRPTSTAAALEQRPTRRTPQLSSRRSLSCSAWYAHPPQHPESAGASHPVSCCWYSQLARSHAL